MVIRSLVISFIILGGLSLTAAAQESPEKRLLFPAPRYVGPMGKGVQTFIAPRAPKPLLLAFGQPMKTLPPSRKSVCYAMRSYAFTTSPGETDLVKPAGYSICAAASDSHLKAARQLPGTSAVPQ